MLDDLSTGSLDNIEHLRDRDRTSTWSSTRVLALVGRQRARLQVRRRLPPGRGGRRAADRRAAGADAGDEPARNRDRARALPPLRQARAHRVDLGGLRRPPRGAAARRDRPADLRPDHAEALGVRRLEGAWTSSSRSPTTQEHDLDCVDRPRCSTPSARARAGSTGWSSPPSSSARSPARRSRSTATETQTRCFCHVADTIRATRAGSDRTTGHFRRDLQHRVGESASRLNESLGTARRAAS